jgi:hypothetical protein
MLRGYLVATTPQFIFHRRAVHVGAVVFLRRPERSEIKRKRTPQLCGHPTWQSDMNHPRRRLPHDYSRHRITPNRIPLLSP